MAEKTMQKKPEQKKIEMPENIPEKKQEKPAQKKEEKPSEKAQIEELTNLLKKVQADFENYTKRVEKEKQRFIEFSCQEFVKSLLPVLDSFESALKNADNQHIKSLYDQLWHILSLHGLSKIQTSDRKFDPYLCEALMQEQSDKPDCTIVEELQAGYKFKGNVIRHAKVKIAKNDKKIDNSGKGINALK